MSKGWWVLYGVVVVVAVGATVVPRAIGSGFHFGINAGSDATPAEVGLPFYPGAKVHKDSDKDNDSAANISGSFGGFGMKIVAVELDTPDAPAKVAPFYWQALGRYGQVLDCSAGKPRPPASPKNSDRLDCSNQHSDPGTILYQAGMKKNFHVAGVEPKGTGSKIALVFVQINGAD